MAGAHIDIDVGLASTVDIVDSSMDTSSFKLNSMGRSDDDKLFVFPSMDTLEQLSIAMGCSDVVVELTGRHELKHEQYLLVVV